MLSKKKASKAWRRPKLFYKFDMHDGCNDIIRIIYPDGLSKFTFAFDIPKGDDELDYTGSPRDSDTPCWAQPGASAERQLELMRAYDSLFLHEIVYLGEL